MKKILVCAAMLAAMVFSVSCGGGSGNDDNGGDGNTTQLCHYGEYKCDGGNSYFCGYMEGSDDLNWKFSEQCANGCDSVTGKCSEGSNSNENGNGNGNENNNGDSDYPAADNSYNANYGFISLNFAFDGIGNADDSDFESDNYEYGWEQGDALEFFKQYKIAREFRPGWPMVYAGNELIWAPGLCRSDFAPVNETTEKIVNLMSTVDYAKDPDF